VKIKVEVNVTSGFAFNSMAKIMFTRTTRISVYGRVLLYAVKEIDLPLIPRKQLLVNWEIQSDDMLESANCGHSSERTSISSFLSYQE
jgi:hypothetical protein